jgi:transposase InsO family protein
MTKATGKRTGAAYTPMPQMPDPVQDRFIAVVKILAGVSTISEQARELALTRTQMQSVLHRSVAAVIEALEAKRPGPRGMPSWEKKLRAENDHLRRHVTKLEKQLDATQSLLGMASQVMRGSRGPTRSPASSKRSSEATTPASEATMTSTDDEEPRARVLRVVSEARQCLPLRVIASALESSVSTLYRWSRAGATVGVAKRKAREVRSEVAARVEWLVRESRGVVGADALRAVTGASRRAAAAIKAYVCTAMERERRAVCRRVEVTVVGVIRGFDAMYLAARDGVRYVLVAADAAVPYRTTTPIVERYDEASVIAAMEADFEAHGAPLVWREDRASCQRTPGVRAVLQRHGVLLLHGPPHHPGYYGQTERQMREHRALLPDVASLPVSALPGEIGEVVRIANEVVPRRALAFRTAGAVWRERPILSDNRAELATEVATRTEELRGRISGAADDDTMRRFAIEQALMARGYLRIV